MFGAGALALASLTAARYLLCTYLGLCLCDAVGLGLKVNAPPVLELQLLQGALQRRTHALFLTPVLGFGFRDGPTARRAHLAFVRVQAHLRETLAELGHLDVHLGESGEQVSRYVRE